MGADLLVLLGSNEIGTLSRTRRGARFQYNEHVVKSSLNAPLLSTALPVKE